MKSLLSNIKIVVPEKIYIKDPETSALGEKIIQYSIELIDQMGFESFTFKKLGTHIKSNESSIYRYFESKHKLLLYLSSWYWSWIEYQLVFETHNTTDAKDKLIKAIDTVTRSIVEDSNYNHINEVTLQRIMINENFKSFLTKEVDQENKEGYFIVYKRIVSRLNDMILEVNPNYKYSLSLASTLTEGSLHQHFLKDHFKTLTNCNGQRTPTTFFTKLILDTIQK